MSKINHIIVALDQMDKESAIQFVKNNNEFSFFKIGIELFYRYGTSIVKEISEIRELDVFLDLKLHDIPKTVAQAIKSLSGLNVSFLTVHASGGFEMLSQARAAQSQFLPNTKLLAVTYLTSLSEEDTQQLFASDLNPTRLAQIAKEAGVQGIVCSPKDLGKMQSIDLEKICPGIRFADDSKSDQKRVMTPEQAFESGADYLVMGRSLTQSNDLKSRINILSKL